MILTLNLRPDVTVLAVLLEHADAEQFKVCNGPNYWVSYMHNKTLVGNDGSAFYDFGPLIPLPPGSYELIGLLREVPEEVAKPLVQEELNGGYREYSSWAATGGLGLNCDTAFDSLKSAIHAAGGDPKQNWLLIKKIA